MMQASLAEFYNGWVWRLGVSGLQPDSWSEPIVELVFVAVTAVALLGLLTLGAWYVRGHVSPKTRYFCQCLSIVGLHISDYATNVALIAIVAYTGHMRYVCVLLPVHAIIGTLCVYYAVKQQMGETQPQTTFANMLYLVLVLGLMQGVQVKLAIEDYRRQTLLAEGGASFEFQVPCMMPARFHCKTMEGIFEGMVFALIAMYLLLKRNWIDFDPVRLNEWAAAALYASGLFSFLTMGMALMELDHRTSTSLQRALHGSSFKQVRHLLFRTSEVTLRLLTILVLCLFMRPMGNWHWFVYGILAVDYLIGVVMLITFGGRDYFLASFLLGIPLLMVNVMAFVDAPGVSLPARRISAILVPWRTIEVIIVVIFSISCSQSIHVQTDKGVKVMDMWHFFWELRTGWVAAWVMSAVLYHLLLTTYAYWMKPDADIHSAVAFGETEELKKLLWSSELVLDINRLGPDGRSPLHLAASKGQVECMKLLIKGRADLDKRTGNTMQNTALHLAATQKCPQALQLLCEECGGKEEVLNAQNADGETALHVAARRLNVENVKLLIRTPRVDVKLKNRRGELAAETGHTNKFAFDRNSPESKIAELLQDAMQGRSTGQVELTDVTGKKGLSEIASPSAEGAHEIAASEITSSSAEGARGSPKESHESEEYGVPLLAIDAKEEEALRERNSQLTPTDTALPVNNCGVSSFMLSAGLGAMSKSLMSTIQEDRSVEENDANVGHVTARLEHFKEEKKLGEGVFGKVFLVTHKTTGEQFAMKLMDKRKFKAQRITSTVHSEQYILKTTRHPFIVSLHYAFQGSNYWVLIMEFCPNGDLQNQLAKHGTPGLPLKLCGRFAGEVLLAIEHLHKINVMFRDLKPENVIVDVNYRAKVTDFGLAKKLVDAADAKTMCGSYGYAAPEIMNSLGRYTFAVDMYSYGVTLYMLISGGEASSSNPEVRIPPMRHASLKRKLKVQKQEAAEEWTRPELGAMDLIENLTSEPPNTRQTATAAKEHLFFQQALGFPVDDLLTPKILIELPQSGDK